MHVTFRVVWCVALARLSKADVASESMSTYELTGQTVTDHINRQRALHRYSVIDRSAELGRIACQLLAVDTTTYIIALHSIASCTSVSFI